MVLKRWLAIEHIPQTPRLSKSSYDTAWSLTTRQLTTTVVNKINAAAPCLFLLGLFSLVGKTTDQPAFFREVNLDPGNLQCRCQLSCIRPNDLKGIPPITVYVNWADPDIDGSSVLVLADTASGSLSTFEVIHVYLACLEIDLMTSASSSFNMDNSTIIWSLF